MFKATVTSIPAPPQINNIANVSFKYRLNPTSVYTDASITSNTVTTNISEATVTNTKSVDKVYATIGNTLTYTSVIKNTGNIDITNTDFIDAVPDYTTFVAGSVKIDSTEYPDYNPNIGFTLGTITPGSSVSVTFKVNVDSLPSNGYVTNASTINYQYKIDPNESLRSSSVISNTVTTYINVGNLSVIKSEDRSIVRLTNTITYKFVIANTETTSAINSTITTLPIPTSPILNPTVGLNVDLLTPLTFTVPSLNVAPVDGVSWNNTSVSIIFPTLVNVTV